MTVLLADERRCNESAEEDRSPQSGGGAYRQAMKLEEKKPSQIRVWLRARCKHNTNEKEPCDQVLF